MRLLTLIALFVVVVIAFGLGSGDDDGVEKATTAAPLLLRDEEEQQHQLPHFYTWDHNDLATTAFEDLFGPAPKPSPLPLDQSEKCPDGWLRWQDSCYWIEEEMLGFAKAERKCAEKHATLFVANSVEEWNALRGHARDGYLSWIGLVRFSRYEKTEQLPRWQTSGALSPKKINWLVKPYHPLTNGWSTYANCAAHFKSPANVDTASYTYFYPCTYLFNSICERNSTILAN